MNGFLNLNTGAKLMVGFGLIVLLLGVVITSAVRGMAGIERNMDLALSLAGFESDLNENRASMLTLLGDPGHKDRDILLADLREQTARGREFLNRVRANAGADAHLLARVEDVARPWGEYASLRDEQILPMVLAGHVTDALTQASGAQHDRYLALRTAARELTGEVRSDSRHQSAAAQLTFFVVGALALLATVLIVWLLSRIIAKPLLAITRAAERIAAGDLSVAIEATGRCDEVGLLTQSFARMSASLQGMAGIAGRIAEGDLRDEVQPQSAADVLGHAFASMVVKLRELTTELGAGIGVLSASAAQISTSTSQLAASASETAAAVSETTTTVEEVRQTAQVSSQKARAVSDSAQRASQVSDSGRRMTEDTAASMGRIQQQMEAIAESMMRLSEQSLEVGQIVATVEDLAAQSKVLAVNASIEAVKAGEFGKGFAVVAQEVRSLAEQSRQATAQVRTILNDIQKATSAAVLATEQGSHAVAAGVQQSREAGQAIQALAGSIGEAAQAATLIAASSQQQRVGVDQVASAMDSIKIASTQNVDSARQLESAARDIHGLGEKLRALAASYRL